MAKSRQSNEFARVWVNPLFAWTNAVLKGGEMMLDSMQAANRNAKNIRVAVLPDSDTPRKRSAPGKQKRARGAKGKRRRS
jgi:hypothetical protein